MPPDRSHSLPDDVIRFAEAQVAAGRFATVEEVIRAGVRALEVCEEAEQDWLADAREKWREGVAASERGEAQEMSSSDFSAWLETCLSNVTGH